ncbi:MAG: NADP-reducing hydrogenase subunit HndA [Syntrophorhabdaceae bacterium PtaU1.Bin034]|jgi:NADH:ubiquinone oxidoreductase subunit E|nr:MAG: NADP-reducing hydrogenase subunit HndA [Syntrophorhabdaceae bacterium PtaU1.Bin034]
MSDEHHCVCAETREEELYPRLAEIVAENKGKPENLIMVLHKAQNLFGYLPKKVQQIVAEGLSLSLSQVYGVVTFYSFFSTSPKGRNSVKVCLGTACYVRGGQQTLAKVEGELDIKVGGTTEDRRYSLDVVRCIGACGLAPAVLVNDDVYGRVKTTKIMEVLDRYE